MTFYYETAPLPTWLAWFMHALPPWWHGVESHATLILELVVPLAIFGPRFARLIVFVIFTGFQTINAATANYGFFCYLSAALNVFLLDDRDVIRIGARVRSWIPWRAAATHRAASRPPRREPPWCAWMRTTLAFSVITLVVSVSIIEGVAAFAGPGAWRLSRCGRYIDRGGWSTPTISSATSLRNGSNRSSRPLMVTSGRHTICDTKPATRLARRVSSHPTSRALTSSCGSMGSASSVAPLTTFARWLSGCATIQPLFKASFANHFLSARMRFGSPMCSTTSRPRPHRRLVDTAAR